MRYQYEECVIWLSADKFGKTMIRQGMVRIQHPQVVEMKTGEMIKSQEVWPDQDDTRMLLNMHVEMAHRHALELDKLRKYQLEMREIIRLRS